MQKHVCVSTHVLSVIHLVGRREIGAVQAGISKFLLLLGNRTGCTVNTGNEGWHARASPILTFHPRAIFKSTPRANFGRGVVLEVDGPQI